MKSHSGYVIDHNFVKGTFLVFLEMSGFKMNFEGNQLIYL